MQPPDLGELSSRGGLSNSIARRCESVSGVALFHVQSSVLKVLEAFYSVSRHFEKPKRENGTNKSSSGYAVRQAAS